MFVESRLLFLVLFLAACGGSKPTAAPAPSAAKVENGVKEGELTTVRLTERAEQRLGIKTAPVTERTAPRLRDVAGEVVAPAGKSVVVSAPLTGTVLLTGLAPGAVVKRRQLLMRLAPLPSAADLSAAEARLVAARKRAQRNADLLKEGAVAERSNDDAQAELALAEANAAAAHPRDGSSAIAALAIDAPFDGVLRELRVGDGQLVAGGAPLFVLEAVNELWVRVPLLASVDAAEVTVTSLATEAKTVVAKRVMNAPPSSDALGATVDTFFSFDNSVFAARTGQRVLVAVPVGGEMASLSVPWSAIAYDINGGTWVYEARGGQAFVRRRVQVRARAGDDALLASGPAVGTNVVTVGVAELLGVEFGAGK
ncbi:MAG: efflux RND transporter periplasmic adaptor subunit [Archangium sp.]